MNYRNIFIFLFPFLLIGCNDSFDKKTVNTLKTVKEKTNSTPSQRTTFLIDNCDINLLVELEEDITKGNDSCVLRIRSLDRKFIKIETLNLPVDKSSIIDCYEDHVIVGTSCGGPCFSRLFVFTDNRKNKQFDYCQEVSNNSNIVTYIQNEEFEKLHIYNLKNGKELEINNPDIHPFNYGRMDTLFLDKKNLIVKYTLENDRQKRKIINLEKILN